MLIIEFPISFHSIPILVSPMFFMISENDFSLLVAYGTAYTWLPIHQ